MIQSQKPTRSILCCKKIIMLCGVVVLPCMLMADTLPEYKSEADKIKGEVVTEVCIDYVKKEYYDNGKLKEEIPYKNCKKEGIEKWYYKNGNLKKEIPYKNGWLEGISKKYYENGKLQAEIPYKKSLQDGMEKAYYENGKLKYEAPFKRYEAFYPYTEIECMLKWYYKNGKLAAEIPYKKHKEGIVKLYKPNGKLLVAIPYHRALRDKAISVKCSNGKVLNEEQLQRIDYMLKRFAPPENDKDIAQICDMKLEQK